MSLRMTACTDFYKARGFCDVLFFKIFQRVSSEIFLFTTEVSLWSQDFPCYVTAPSTSTGHCYVCGSVLTGLTKAEWCLQKMWDLECQQQIRVWL